MKLFNIGEVSAITNISRDRIRNYEKKGMLFPTRDAENDYRLYSEKDIVVLQAIEMYRYADFGIDEITSICTNGSVDTIYSKALKKQTELDAEIKRLNNYQKRNIDLIRKCQMIKENLNVCSISSYDDFEIIGEINDYTSFNEYANIYSVEKSDKPILYKLQRMIEFDENGIISNKMIVTRPLSKARKVKCLYMVVEDGEKTADAMHSAFPKCINYCKENGIEPIGKVYIGMMMLFCDSKKVVTYLEIKAPLKNS